MQICWFHEIWSTFNLQGNWKPICASNCSRKSKILLINLWQRRNCNVLHISVECTTVHFRGDYSFIVTLTFRSGASENTFKNTVQGCSTQKSCFIFQDIAKTFEDVAQDCAPCFPEKVHLSFNEARTDFFSI